MRRSAATSTDPLLAPEAFRYHFIGGKGGVGKTTCAAALAIRAARLGRRTLVVSTDPAPSLADAFGQPLGPAPRRVRGARGLHAMELDARAAFAGWLAPRRSTLALLAARGTWLDAGDTERLLELSLPAIDELAALLEVAALGEGRDFDHVIVDAAPTGHLLRMLATPELLQRVVRLFDWMQAKHRAMVAALSGSWTGDAADTLILDMERQVQAMAALLRDRRRTLISWITLPEALSVEETRDALTRLQHADMAAGLIIVNRLTRAPRTRCAWCDARRRTEAAAVARLRQQVGAVATPLVGVAAADREPRGVATLARFGARMSRSSGVLRRRSVAPPRRTLSRLRTADRPAAEPLAAPPIRLLLFGGKGGVGKTTCAAAAALHAAALAPARRVLLLSTDPAHSLGDVLGQRCDDSPRPVRGGPANLAVRELDASGAFAGVRERFVAGVDALFRRTSGAVAVDATYDRQVMRHLLDVAPPGVDELAAIVEIVGYVEPAGTGQYDLVVMDTAPTGHTLRLLEMPETLSEWTRAMMAILLKYQAVVGLGELASGLLRLSRGLRTLGTLLRDPSQTRFATVTRAAALPRAETVRLLDSLAAARIPSPLVIVNAAGAGSCRRCADERRGHEQEIVKLRRDLDRADRPARRLLVAPAELPPPYGARRLQQWRGAWGALEAPGRAVAPRRRRVR